MTPEFLPGERIVTDPSTRLSVARTTKSDAVAPARPNSEVLPEVLVTSIIMKRPISANVAEGDVHQDVHHFAKAENGLGVKLLN